MAQDINVLLINGRLVRDSELKTTQTGTPILTFSIASNYATKKGDKWEEDSNFFDVKMFGNRADALRPHLIKGKLVSVEGELRQERWEQEGQNRSKIVIYAKTIQLLSSSQSSDAEKKQTPGNKAGTEEPKKVATIPKETEVSAFDDDSFIPF